MINKNLEALKHNDKKLHRKVVAHLSSAKGKIEINKDKVEFYNSLIKEQFSNIDKEHVIFSYGADLESFYALGSKVLGNENNNVKYIILLEFDINKICRILACVDCVKMLENNILKILCLDTQEKYHSRLSAYFMKNPVFLSSGLFVANYINVESFQSDIDRYTDLLMLCKKMMFNAAINLGNNPEDAFVGLHNIIKNLNKCYPALSIYKNEFKGMQAILVTAGPSLQKDIKTLKSLKDKAFICCVDTAYKTLLEAGFSPHMVVGVERTETVINYYKDMEKYKGYDKNVLLALSSLTNSDVYDYVASRGKSLVHHKNYTLFEYLNMDTIQSGKGVASCALNVLNYMGFRQIYLVGQDLCFQDGKSHAEGDGCKWSSDNVMKSRIGFNKFTAVGNNGNVQTTDTWYKFKAVYEKDLQKINAEVINCTVDGLKIGDIEVKQLQDVTFFKYSYKIKAMDIYNQSSKEDTGWSEYSLYYKNRFNSKNELIDIITTAAKEIQQVVSDEEKVDILAGAREEIKENRYYDMFVNVITNSFEYAIDAGIEKAKIKNPDNYNVMYNLYLSLFDVYAMTIDEVEKKIWQT